MNSIKRYEGGRFFEYWFNPKENITSYELALCVWFLGNPNPTYSAKDSKWHLIKRHWRNYE